jgi:hypothetical protein
MMTELHELLRRDLELLRDRQSPPPGVDARVLEAVEAIGFGPEGPSEPDTEPDVGWDGAANDVAGHAGHAGHAGAQLVWVAKIVAATLALTGAGLLGIGATARVIRANQAQSSSVTSGVDTTATIATTDAGPELPTPPPPPLTEQVVPGLEATEPATEQARSTISATPLPSPTTEVQHPDPLAAELALIEAARTAVDAASALALLRQHARRFPDGLLATERELLIIERLCALGEYDTARRMFAAHRDAPQRARLLDLCPELGNDAGTDPRDAGHE